jgi:aspartyl/glutamyl-tRNA(Asn/Gln) amidotransferase C subunit
MPISLDEVRHVAKLARLQLDDAEILALQGELNALLGHFADIQGLNVQGVQPQSQAVAVQNVWGEDFPEDCLAREEALRHAPMSKAGLFVAPTIIED